VLRFQVDTIQIWSCEEWSAQPLASRWLEWLVAKMRRLEVARLALFTLRHCRCQGRNVGYHVGLEFTYRCQPERFSHSWMSKLSLHSMPVRY
jgi:hypothetical protein